MSLKSRFATAAAVALALAAIGPTASAAVIAQFTPDSRSVDYSWVRDAAGTGGTLSSVGHAGPTAGCTTCVATHFSFLDPALSSLAFVPTTFKIAATVPDATPASVNGAGVWTQTQLSGTFSFTYWDKTKAFGTSQIVGGFALVNGITKMLSGIFTDGWIQGAGGSGSTNEAVINGGSATYTTSLLPPSYFEPGTSEFALNMLGVTPHFSAASGKALNSFRANGGGNFSATVPEPAVWGLMVLGFAGVGVVIRRRQRATAVAAA
jgi:hypothetical protein